MGLQHTQPPGPLPFAHQAGDHKLWKEIQPAEEVAKPQLSLPRGQEELGGREGGGKAGTGCKPSMAQAPLLSSAAQSEPSRDPPMLNAAGPCWSHRDAWVPGNARDSSVQDWGAASTPEEGSAWRAEPLPQTLQHKTVTKGHFYYSIAIICARLAQPGLSWSLSLASLGTRLWFQTGRQPRPTYQPVTFPSRLAFPPGCQQTQPRNSRGCLTTLC